MWSPAPAKSKLAVSFCQELLMVVDPKCRRPSLWQELQTLIKQKRFPLMFFCNPSSRSITSSALFPLAHMHAQLYASCMLNHFKALFVPSFQNNPPHFSFLSPPAYCSQGWDLKCDVSDNLLWTRNVLKSKTWRVVALNGGITWDCLFHQTKCKNISVDNPRVFVEIFPQQGISWKQWAAVSEHRWHLWHLHN